MSWLSKQLGRNHAYIQQYISTHKPQDLDYRDKLKVAALLDIPLTDLGIDVPADYAPSKAFGLTGLAEEAESYAPPRGSFLAAAPHIAYFTARSNALDRHRLMIRTGDVVVANIGESFMSQLRSEDAVIVQLYNKQDTLRAITVIREYIAPGLLITNSSTVNSIWRMDDNALPFEPVIKGRIESTVRPSY